MIIRIVFDVVRRRVLYMWACAREAVSLSKTYADLMEQMDKRSKETTRLESDRDDVLARVRSVDERVRARAGIDVPRGRHS